MRRIRFMRLVQPLSCGLGGQHEIITGYYIFPITDEVPGTLQKQKHSLQGL